MPLEQIKQTAQNLKARYARPLGSMMPTSEADTHDMASLVIGLCDHLEKLNERITELEETIYPKEGKRLKVVELERRVTALEDFARISSQSQSKGEVPTQVLKDVIGKSMDYSEDFKG